MSDEQDQDRWARLRFAVVGPLLAAPPARGELQQALRELSDRRWSHPNDATLIQFGFSTIERWYHTARRAPDPIAALRRQRRDDAYVSRQLTPALCQQIDARYQQNSGWTMQLRYDNLSAHARKPTSPSNSWPIEWIPAKPRSPEWKVGNCPPCEHWNGLAKATGTTLKVSFESRKNTDTDG